MDTRFWGPSGWQLYHLVAHSYKGTQTEQYKAFFMAMKDVLPCKFCRESTTIFVNENPPDMSNIKEWMYDFHNKVNNKLRSQCKQDTKVICPPPDPTFIAVSGIYSKLLEIEPTSPPGIDYLFCLAYNYNEASNKEAYAATFDNLKIVYPFNDLKSCIPSKAPLQSRESLLKWFYKVAKCLSKKTEFKLGSYVGTLQRYGTYKSGCKRGKTCRNGKKIRDHKKTYKITHERLLKLY